MLHLFLAFFLSIFFIYLLWPFALKIGWVDVPGGRKHHQGEIPLIGGAAMFLAFSFTLLTLNFSLMPYRALIGSSALLILVGILDDFHELSATSRFLAQVLAAILMATVGHNSLNHLGNLLGLGSIQLYDFSIPLTLFATVGFINALNMLDGLDGLAGSQCAISLGFLIISAYLHGQVSDALILIAVLGSALGFLIFNFPFPFVNRAKLFMGDAGSMWLGFILCWFAISLSQEQNAVLRPVTMLWIFAVPLADTVRLILKRSLQRKSPLSASRDHIHHLLLYYGFSARVTVYILSCCSLFLGAIGVFASFKNVSDSYLFYAFIGLFLVFFGMPYLIKVPQERSSV